MLKQVICRTMNGRWQMKKILFGLALIIAGMFLVCSCNKKSANVRDHTPLPSSSPSVSRDEIKNLFQKEEIFSCLFEPIAKDCIACIESIGDNGGQNKMFLYRFDEETFFSDFTYQGEPIAASALRVNEKTIRLVGKLKELCPSLSLSIVAPISDAPGEYYVSFATIFRSPTDGAFADSEEIIFFPSKIETDFFAYHERIKDNWYYIYTELP